jgi:divalent metal cation (Fe/Co/Zn/Cd) transporter
VTRSGLKAVASCHISVTTEAVVGRRRRARRLATFTVAWNIIEGAVAVGGGIAAGSIALTGFGIDSFVECASAIIVALRLSAELAGRPANEHRERNALRAIALSFFALAAYVSAASVWALAHGERPRNSPVGIAVTVVSLAVMFTLARSKRRVGLALGNQLIAADAAETKLCSLLSAATLAGLVANFSVGWWWVDPLAGLVIAWLALREGREAWHGELCCDDD